MNNIVRTLILRSVGLVTNRTLINFDKLSQDRQIAVASSVTVFVVASILFFIVGFLCGHFCRKERKPAEIVPPAAVQTQIPYYDDVVLKQELELKANVAYGSVQ